MKTFNIAGKYVVVSDGKSFNADYKDIQTGILNVSDNAIVGVFDTLKEAEAFIKSNGLKRDS